MYTCTKFSKPKILNSNVGYREGKLCYTNFPVVGWLPALKISIQIVFVNQHSTQQPTSVTIEANKATISIMNQPTKYYLFS